MADIKKIGVMTCGGDCPGLNAVMRGVVCAAESSGWEIVGIEDSMCGLIDLNYRSPFGNMRLDTDRVDDIMRQGGTILGCSNRSDPFRYATVDKDGNKIEIDVADKVIENYQALALDALVVIGGDGSMRIAHKLAERSKGAIRVVGCPKTIDNDLIGTDITFGFDSAVQTIAEACDKIQDTARSHDRIIVVETMGRDAGWLALHGGLAGNASVILLPEIPYSIESVRNHIEGRKARGYPFTVIAIAEGAKPKGGEASLLEEKRAGEMRRYAGAGNQLVQLLKALDPEIDVRVSVLGYIQRGGSPTASDRVLGTMFGVHAVDMIKQGKFNHLSGFKNNQVVSVPFDEVTHGQKVVDPTSQVVITAKAVGVCFGD